MKFEFEKIDSRFLARRASEEEQRSGGKRVTRIVLTHPEWAELLRSQGYREGEFAPRTYKVARMPRLVTAFDSSYLDKTIQHIEVVCEHTS